MNIDINTFTNQQKEMLLAGYTFKLSEKGKLIEIEPEEKNEKYIEYKTKEIQREFESKISQFTAGYTQAEIDTWNTKVEEAKKVLAGEGSELLESLLIEGETLEGFAQNILEKARLYSQMYMQAEKTKRQQIKDLTTR